jgi:O-antigen/teichoic acid export membrane protein
MISEMAPRFDFRVLTATLAFGFPLIFASLANVLLNMGNRYLLKLLADYREVGLYNLGYRVAGILNMFLIQSFLLALLPIAYKIYGQEGDKRYYSKMLTYFVFALSWVGLGLTFFGKEIIEVLALNPDYWPAYRVVPYIVLAYIFSGAKAIADLGLYLKSRTDYIAYNTIGAVVLNVGLSFALIPRYGMIGAAVATTISFAALYVVTCFIANRSYRIPYENLKLLKALILAIALFFLSTLTVDLDMFPRILTKLGILISFPLLLYIIGFYEDIEIQKIEGACRRIIGVTKKPMRVKR